MNKFKWWWFLNNPRRRGNLAELMWDTDKTWLQWFVGKTRCTLGIHQERVRKFAGRNQRVCERYGARD